MKPPGYNPNVPREDSSVEEALATPAPGEEAPLAPPPIVSQGEEASDVPEAVDTPKGPADAALPAEPAVALAVQPLGSRLQGVTSQLQSLGSVTDPAYLASLLPTRKSPVKTSFAGSIIMIYGPPKIGKSDLASQFPTPWFLATEEGHAHLSIFKSSITSWQHYLDTIQALVTVGAQQELPYQTIVIDTVDLMFDFCLTHYCQSKGIEHPSEEGYGKGWEGLKQQWQRGIYTLVKLGYTVVLISHAKPRKVLMHGIERDQIGPSLANTANKVVLPTIDYVIYLDYCSVDSSKDGRKMVLRGDDTIVAGDRSGFFTPEIFEVSYEALEKDFRENVAPKLAAKYGKKKEEQDG